MTMFKTTFHDLRDRYHRDAKFKATVDLLVNFMQENKWTPYEMRDCADMASLVFSEIHQKQMWYSDRFPEAKELLNP